MIIEPTITWVPSGFSGNIHIWLDTKIVLKNLLWGDNDDDDDVGVYWIPRSTNVNNAVLASTFH